MATINKDLGMATAYAYAVSKGYTGTEEEFAQYIANVGQNAQAAAESAESAARSATTAGQSAESAAHSALEVSRAVEDVEAAATAAGESEAAASDSADDAQADALKAEGFAVGKQDGVDVDAQSEYYQNNSKYYKDQAKSIYDDAVGVRDSIPADYSKLSQDVTDLKADLSESVSDLKSAFDTIANPETNQSFWTQGALNVLTGVEATNAKRIKTGYISEHVSELRVADGYVIILFCYDSNDAFAGTWNGTAAVKIDPPIRFTGTVALANLRTYKIRVHAKALSNTNVTPANDYACVEFVRYTDSTLTKTAIPADAEATGNAIRAVEENLLNITQPFVKLTKGSSIFTVEEGYYATTGNKTALAGYVLCSYTADVDFEIYADETTLAETTALFVSIYNNSIASRNNVACYKRNTQENTLPTEANKATVYAGQILAISIYTPSTSPTDFGIYADYKKVYTIKPEIDFPTKYTNFPYGKKIAWFGDSISELKQLPHIAGMLLNANVYDCSIRGSTVGRTYSNYNEFSFYNLVTSVISRDFSAQFDQLDAYEQAQGRTFPGIRENLTTLSMLDFDDVDYVVLLHGTNDFGITAVHAAEGYATKIDEMKAHMDDAISRFITAYPKLKFYIISPPFRATPTEDYYGDTLADYIAAEREVAEKYAIPFYNLLINSRICDENKTTYMNSDSGVYVHPNDYGDAWLAELAAKFISVS